jgi:hypothetical protein
MKGLVLFVFSLTTSQQQNRQFTHQLKKGCRFVYGNDSSATLGAVGSGLIIGGTTIPMPAVISIGLVILAVGFFAGAAWVRRGGRRRG